MDRFLIRVAEAGMMVALAGMVLMVWLGPSESGFDIGALLVGAILPISAIVNFEHALAGRSETAGMWAVLAALATLVLALPAIGFLSYFVPH